MTQHFAGKALNADVQPARTWTGHSRRLRNPARNDGVHRALGTAPPSLLVENPDRFDPDRFTPARSAGRPRHAYLPFAGPRTCIGSHLALMEIQVVLALVASRCRLRLTSDHPVPAQALITTRPRTPIRRRPQGDLNPCYGLQRRAERRFFAIFATQKALAEGPGRGRSNAHTLFGMTATFARKSRSDFGLRCASRPDAPLAHCPPSPATTISGRCWTGRRRTISDPVFAAIAKDLDAVGGLEALRRLMGGC